MDGFYWTAGEYALAREGFLTAWPDGYSVVNELRRPGALAKDRDLVLQAIARGELAARRTG